MPLMQFVYLEDLKKKLALDLLEKNGFSEKQIIEIGKNLKEKISLNTTFTYDKKIIKAIKIYNKKSILLQIDSALDCFFNYIFFKCFKKLI
jgi:uncharacterized protein YdaL